MKETAKKYLPAIGLAICVLVLAWSYIDLYTKYSALEKSHHSLEQGYLDKITETEKLKKELEAETFQIQEREERIAELKKQIDQLNQPTHEDVDTIPDTDVKRISELFSAYY